MAETEETESTPIDLAVAVDQYLIQRGRPSPGSDVLAILFRRLFRASLSTEEGRPITFEVTWMDPDNPDPSPPPGPRADYWKAFSLGSRAPLTVQNLVKVATATDPRTSSLAVYHSADDGLFLWGIVDQGTQSYGYRRHEKEGAVRPAGLFQASAKALGHVVVNLGYEPMAELRIDRLIVRALDPLARGPLREALYPGVQNHLSRVLKTVEGEYIDDGLQEEFDELWTDILAERWFETIARLLLRIQSFHHGGALLITPDEAFRCLNIKYPITYDRIPRALQNAAKARILGSEADNRLMEDIDQEAEMVSAFDYLEAEVSRNEQEDRKSELDGALWFVATISRVDGLVLCDPGLTVHGFGTMIETETLPNEIAGAGDDLATPESRYHIAYEQFGSRHRSMMRYVASVPGSVGFVVSQDGDVRAIGTVGDTLLIWDGIRLEMVSRDWDGAEFDDDDVVDETN